MTNIELKRGYEVLPDNNVRFGIRVTNNSDYAISDVEVILDYNESLFVLEGSTMHKLGTIPPALPRTAEFILKPRGCIHKEEIAATIRYKDHQWERHTQEMQPKEVHCVCPFLKEKSLTRADFLALSKSGYLEERGVNFEGITLAKLADFILHTCKNRLYKVDEFSIENGKILYLAGDALGEKAYYLLTAVAKEYDGVTQVLLRAASNEKHGLNGFLNEIMDNLRHLVTSASAREIGIIKKEQVINIIDSVVQRTTFAGGDGGVNIEGSVVQRTEIGGDEEKRQQEEERLRKEKEEQERLRQEEAENKEKERRTREGLKTRKAGGGSSRKKFLAVILVLSTILLGYGVFALYSPDAPEPLETTPLPTLAVTQTGSQAPAPTVTSSPSVAPISNPIIWQESDMGFTLEEQEHLAIGAGRGDDVMRVYSTTDEIHEYTYLNGHWEIITFGDAFLRNSGIAIGDVRNDGKDRVYITKYSVHEYYYNSEWVGDMVRKTSIIDEEGIVIGDVRNDGVDRIYICDSDGTEELSYNYGDWDLMEINNQPYAKLTITDGRNDGILRLYAAIDDHVYEFSWSGGSDWQVDDCGSFNIYNDLSTICAGNARNDGKNRIYVSGDSRDSDGAIYELSYDGQSWQHITVSDSVTVDHMVIANGRNDGVNRLYTGSSKGVGEYTYSGSWAKTSLIETSFEVNGLAIGDGRNDGVNRVYVTGDDKHIYEYSAG